jgi:hypothetical protein
MRGHITLRQGRRTANRLYRINGAEYNSWTKYSSFEAPDIENPYFNLGVDSVDNAFITALYGKVHFFK